MTRDERILDLLANWAESRERGGNLAVDDLCRDEPDLSGELRARIEMLDAMRWLEDQQDEEPDGDELLLPDYSTLVRRHEETLQAELQLPLAEFEHSLTSCGLVSAAEVRNIVEDSGAPPVTSAVDLARALVLRGKLTPFQARMIAQGKGQELVLGNYVLLDKIGEGGMGQVFKARHRRMKRVVAIKVLPPSTMNSPHAVERFHREVEAVARLEHPNIVTAHDADEAGGRHFLAMQYVEGRDLASLVRSGGPLSIGQAVSVLLQAAAGLAYAHQQGIVHRDIKPGNLLIDRSGTLKILDLGLARIQADAGEDGSPGELTTDGTVMGTVDYMAPEQAIDTHAADARSDIYSLGCTLYYLLTGKPLFGGSTFMAKMLAHREQPIPDLAAARPETPACLVQIFGKMVAKEPAQRPPSMLALLEELKQCAELSEALALPAQWETGPGRSPTSSFEPIILRDSRETTNSRIEETIDLPDSQAGAPSEVHAPATKAQAAAVPEISVATQPALPLEEGQQEGLASRWRQRPLVAAAVALALAGVILLAGIVYRIQTDRGTIVVEFDDEQVAAKLQKDGLVIEDTANKRTWKLAAQAPEKVPTGEYKLAAPDGLKLQVTDDTGTDFATGEFTIKRGGKVIVRVTAEPLAVAADTSPKPTESATPTEPAATPMPAGTTAATPASTPPAAEAPSGTDPDRIAAEWVQRQKGKVELQIVGANRVVISQDQPLPQEPFHVTYLDLGAVQPAETDWSALGGLKYLERICIFNAQAGIPYAALKDVQSLQELRLIEFQDDDVLDGIEALSHLPKVWLTGSVNETQIASLAKHPNLRQLLLDHHGHLPAEVFEDLTKLPALVDLYLTCPLDDEDFHSLARLTNLERLRLGHHLFLWNSKQLASLKTLAKLQSLEAAFINDPRPPLAEMAQGMPELEELRLTIARVLEPEALAGLAEHPTLRRLVLHEAPVKDSWLPQFHNWKQLRELHYNASVGAQAEQELLRANPNLSLHFANGGVLTYWNSGAVIEGPVPFPKELPGIRRWQIVTTNAQTPQYCCAYSRDGRWLAIASSPSPLVRIYDGDSHELKQAFSADQPIGELYWTADERLVLRGAAGHEPAKVFELGGKLMAVGEVYSARGIAVHPREPLLALGHINSGAIQLVGLDGKAGPTLAGPAGGVFALAWHPAGDLLASVTTGDKAIRLWKRTGELEKTIELPLDVMTHGTSPLAWNPAGTLLAAVTEDAKTHVFQSDGTAAGNLPISVPLTWHPKEDVLYGWAYLENTNGLFGFSPTGERKDFLLHYTGVTSASWHPDGLRLATVAPNACLDYRKTPEGWQAEWKKLSQIAWNTTNPNAIAWSADGQTLWRPFGNRITRWQADGTEVTTTFTVPAGQWPDAIARNPAKPLLLATNGATSEGYLFAADGQRQRTIRSVDSNVGTPAWSPSGEWAVMNTPEGEVRLYNADGRRSTVLQGAKAGTAVIAWSADSQRIALAVQGQPAGIWNVDGTPGPKLQLGKEYAVTGLAFSPDGSRLAASATSVVLGICNTSDGALERPLPEAQVGVNLINLQWRDDDTIVGISAHGKGNPDGGIRRWNAQGKYLGSEPLPPGALVASHADPQGQRRVTVYFDLRHIVTDENHQPQFVGQPLGWDGDWISLSADGRLLHQSQNAEQHYRYLVELDDGRFETLTPAEFHERTGGVLRQKPPVAGANPTAAGNIDRSAARWALGLGGKVELFVGDEFRELSSASELPAEGTIRLQAIELPAGATISDSQFAALARLPALQTLGCHGANLTDSAGPQLAQLAGLEQLGLGKTKVTDAILEHVAKLPQLAHLRLGETRVTDAGLKYLAECKSLRELDLQQTAVTAAGVAELERALPGCQIVAGTK